MTRFFFFLMSCSVCGAFAMACGGEDPINNPPIDKPLEYNSCSADKKIGGFKVQLAEKATAVEGQVFTGVKPQNVPEIVETVGDCQLMQGKKLFCNPNCTPGKTCNEKGVCIDEPVGQSVGEVSVTGLKSDVKITPRIPIYYYIFTGDMPHPGFDTAAAIALSAKGAGENEAFSLRGWGIEPLTVTSKSIEVKKGKSLDLTWKPPTKEGPTKVLIKLNINNHGSSSNWISCKVEDKGSASIPASLIEKLFAAGTSGFPDITFTRQSADSTTIKSGCVDFLVLSMVNTDVTVEGVKSCSSDKDCDKGQSCQADLTCK